MRRTRSSVLGVVGFAGLVCLLGAGCADGTSTAASGAKPATNASAGVMGSPVGQGGSSTIQPGTTTAANNPGANATSNGSTSQGSTSPVSNQVTKDTTAMAVNATNQDATGTQTAMFGAGCFWGVQSKFDKMPGVIETAVGYAGGQVANPTYKQVCTDETGHAEVVHITFDPAKISYQQLVDAFFTLHDPTQLNRQGPDYGSQYRTVIFYYSPEQQTTAQETIQRLGAAKKFARPIVTQVVPAAEFWKAEEYHQKYLKKRGLDDCSL